MKNDEKKKGLLAGLFGSNKKKPSSGCCSIEIEELMEEEEPENNIKGTAETSKSEN